MRNDYNEPNGKEARMGSTALVRTERLLRNLRRHGTF